jgi:hypothetical protein
MMVEKKNGLKIGDSTNMHRLHAPYHNGSLKLLYAITGVMMVIIIGMGGSWAMHVNQSLDQIHDDIGDFTSSFIRKDEIDMVLTAQADIIAKQINRMHESAVTHTKIFERIVQLMEKRESEGR